MSSGAFFFLSFSILFICIHTSVEYLGLILAVLIGLLLGLLGGGGSILAVPIFVYVLGLDPKIAIATSLAVVGLTSLVGTYPHYRAGNLDWRTGLLFAAGSILSTFLAARELSGLMSGTTQMILFGIVMFTAALFMFRGRKNLQEHHTEERSIRSLILVLTMGIGVGVLTGLVGVGGGFMIVPSLVLLGNVSMKRAVGTSLMVIALNSVAGVIGYFSRPEIQQAVGTRHIGKFDLITFLSLFAAVTISGVFLGSSLNKRVNAASLRKGFAVFLIIMAVFILLRNSGLI